MYEYYTVKLLYTPLILVFSPASIPKIATIDLHDDTA